MDFDIKIEENYLQIISFQFFFLRFDFTFASSDSNKKIVSDAAKKMRLFLPLLYEGSQPPHEAIHCFDQASSLRCVTDFVGL